MSDTGAVTKEEQLEWILIELKLYQGTIENNMNLALIDVSGFPSQTLEEFKQKHELEIAKFDYNLERYKELHQRLMRLLGKLTANSGVTALEFQLALNKLVAKRELIRAYDTLLSTEASIRVFETAKLECNNVTHA